MLLDPYIDTRNFDISPTCTTESMKIVNTNGGNGVLIDFSNSNTGSPLVINSNPLAQDVSITATVALTGDLQVNGNVNIYGQILAHDGTQTTPSIKFTEDLNTCFYADGPDNLSISTGGIQRASFVSTTTIGTPSESTTINITAGTDLINLTCGIVGAETQDINSLNTAINLTSLATTLVADGSNYTSSLADGTVGQIKVIGMSSTSGGSFIVTPTNFLGWTNITFDATGESVTLMFATGGWMVIGVSGATANFLQLRAYPKIK